MDGYSFANMILDGSIVVASVGSVLLFGAFCHAGQPKPAEVYDTGPEVERLRQQKLAMFRQMLMNSRTDDEASDAIDWARYALHLGNQDIETVLDEVQPLGSPDQKAALAVRAMFQLGHAY